LVDQLRYAFGELWWTRFCQPIELKQTQPGKIASGERRGHGERVCGDEVKQIQSGEMAVTELRSRGERFRSDELNRPHSSLDGLTHTSLHTVRE